MCVGSRVDALVFFNDGLGAPIILLLMMTGLLMGLMGISAASSTE